MATLTAPAMAPTSPDMAEASASALPGAACVPAQTFISPSARTVTPVPSSFAALIARICA